MVLLLVVRAEITAGAQRLAHIAEAQRTGVFVVVEQQRHFFVAGVILRRVVRHQTGVDRLPAYLILRAVYEHRSAERVWVRHTDGALCAVQLKAALCAGCVMHIKCRADLRHRAVCKRNAARQMRVDIDVDFLAVVRLGRDDTLRERLFRHADDALRFADELH